MNDIKFNNHKNLLIHLKLLFKEAGNYLKVAIKTMIENFEYIKNALIYSYSNGYIEGINNYIKVLKRNAYGYKSFFHFKNRILITRKLTTAFNSNQLDLKPA